MFIVLSYCLW